MGNFKGTENIDICGEGSRKIRILLSRFPDHVSRLVSVVTGFYYTHASIGLDEDGNTFYSFVWKGFLVEKLTHYVRPDRQPFPCELYELEVPDAAYHDVKQALQEFARRKDTLRYDPCGVVLSFLHIPHISINHFFCSQFVAVVLGKCHVVCLNKNSSLYFPQDLRDLSGMRLIYQGNMKELLDTLVLPA